MENAHTSIARSFLFVPQLDIVGRDIRRISNSIETMLIEALNNPECVAVNTLGFMKNTIDCLNQSQYLNGAQDGVYIKISALAQLARTNPQQHRLIESLAVPVQCRVTYGPDLDNTGFWMSQSQLALKTFHMNNLAKIAIARATRGIEGNVVDGGCGTDWFKYSITQSKQRNIYDLAKVSSHILGVGFNTGFSCLLMLLANSFSKITLVDIAEHGYVQPCFDYLDKAFPGRLVLIKGSSHDTLPSMPKASFDLIHVDGDHSNEGARLDLLDILPFCRLGTIILFDDTDLEQLNQIFVGYVHTLKMRKYDILPTFRNKHDACQVTIETMNLVNRALESGHSTRNLLQ